jgi:hypothetical protein
MHLQISTKYESCRKFYLPTTLIFRTRTSIGRGRRHDKLRGKGGMNLREGEEWFVLPAVD